MANLEGIFSRATRVVVVFFVSFVLISTTTGAETQSSYLKVIDVSGRAEIFQPESKAWSALKAPILLTAGVRIRTDKDSSVEISSSFDHFSLMKVGGDSLLEVMGEDFRRVWLVRGMFFLLREEDGNSFWGGTQDKTPFQVFSKHCLVSLLKGGCSVAVNEKGAWVRVFSESVEVADTSGNANKTSSSSVSEGFKLFVESNFIAHSKQPARMNYEDYLDWQLWIRRCYKRKDERVTDLFKKQGIIQ